MRGGETHKASPPLHILADVHGYPPRLLAGAEFMLHSLLREMVRRGHEAIVCAPAGRAVAGKVQGVEVVLNRSRELYEWADVVITHLDTTRDAVGWSMTHGKPLVHIIHNHRQLSWHHVPAEAAAMVVFNTQWLSDEIAWRGPQVIVRPPVWPMDYETARGDAITLVNTCADKGGELFAALAKAMPKRTWLGVKGSYGVPAPMPPGVEVVAKTTDMRSVYAKTRLILMPSRYESWGRVAIEAACSGIPTIAAPTPGLREALGPAGIFVGETLTDGYASLGKPKEWEAAIRKLDDPMVYAAASKAAKARAAQLDPIVECDLFEAALVRASRMVIAKKGIVMNGVNVLVLHSFNASGMVGVQGQTLDLPQALATRLERIGAVKRLGKTQVLNIPQQVRAPERAVGRSSQKAVQEPVAPASAVATVEKPKPAAPKAEPRAKKPRK